LAERLVTGGLVTVALELVVDGAVLDARCVAPPQATRKTEMAAAAADLIARRIDERS
jgi:hypothetical protein